MDTEPRMTDALLLRISEKISEVYTTMLESCSDRSRASLASAVEESILDVVEYTLAASHRLRNAQHSLQHCVPDETWCHIWTFLAFPDRLAITHTCNAWRNVALACPKLWQAVTFYSSRHASHCYCDDCADPRDLRDTHPSGWAHSPYDADATNVYWALDILARSCALPLYLTFDIVPFCASIWPLRDLASALAEHTSRLTTLRIRSGHCSAAHQFLREFKSLPVLRELITVELANEMGLTEEVSLIPPQLDLPALTSLKLDHGFMWTRDGSRQFETLRDLSIRLLCDPEEELLPALAACPQLESLRVDFLRLGARRRFFLAIPTQHILPDTLSYVTLVSLGPNLAEWALDVLNCPECPEVAMELKYGSADIAVAAPLFADLADPVQLRLVSHSRGHLFVAGADGSGRVRSVEYDRKTDPACVLLQFPKLSVVSRHVTKLSVSSRLLYLLASVWPSAPSVVELEITLVDEGHDGSDDSDSRASGAPTPQFPAVRTVRLIGGDGGCTRAISERDVADILYTLTLRLPLETLTIDRRIFEGPSAALETLARSVHVDF